MVTKWYQLTIRRSYANGQKANSKPPLVVPMIKELLELSEHLDPTVGTMMEREKFSVLFATEDKTEGMKAFLEGRRAEFKGK